VNLIVDINVLCPLFDTTNPNHNDFLPVLNSINNRRSIMVYGGTKFLSELSKLKKYQPLIIEWLRAGKAKVYPVDDVDSETNSVVAKESDADFDDPHLIAIVIVCHATVVCTLDVRAEKFLKDPKFYVGTPVSRPRIYKRAEHASLLP
jgi:hypothetical protein